MNHDKYESINIHDLVDGDEETRMWLKNDLISGFSCPINPDVERFLKRSSVEFAKKSQSVTYLVFSNDDNRDFVGYYTLAIKPLSIRDGNIFSKTMRKRIMRTSELDESSNTFSTAA